MYSMQLAISPYFCWLTQFANSQCLSADGSATILPSLVIASFSTVKGSLRTQKVEEWYERQGKSTSFCAVGRLKPLSTTLKTNGMFAYVVPWREIQNSNCTVLKCRMLSAGVAPNEARVWGYTARASLASEIIAAILLHLEIWHWWLVISRTGIDFLWFSCGGACLGDSWNSINMTSSRKSLLMGFFRRTPMVTWLLLLSWAGKRRCSQFVGNSTGKTGKTLQFQAVRWHTFIYWRDCLFQAQQA